MSSNIPDNLDEQLSAYLDGELTDKERQEIDRLLDANAEVLARLDALRQTVKLVQSLPRHDAPPSLSDDLAAQAERQMLLGDDEFGSTAKSPRRRPIISLLATAALVTITVGGAFWVVVQVGRQGAKQGAFGPVARTEPSQPIPGRDDAMSADERRDRRARPTPPKSEDASKVAEERPAEPANQKSRPRRIEPAAIPGKKAARPAEAEPRARRSFRPEKRKAPRAEIAGAIEPRPLADAVDAVDAIAAKSAAEASELRPAEREAPDLARSDTDVLEVSVAGARIGEQPLDADAASEDIHAGLARTRLPVLRVDCRNEAGREASFKRLARLFETQDVVLGGRNGRPGVGSDLDTSQDAYFGAARLHGRDTTEIVVSVPVADLGRFVDSLAGPSGSPNRIALEVGPLAAAGPDEVKRLLGFAAPPVIRAAGAVAGAQPAPATTESDEKKEGQVTRVVTGDETSALMARARGASLKSPLARPEDSATTGVSADRVESVFRSTEETQRGAVPIHIARKQQARRTTREPSPPSKPAIAQRKLATEIRPTTLPSVAFRDAAPVRGPSEPPAERVTLVVRIGVPTADTAKRTTTTCATTSPVGVEASTTTRPVRRCAESQPAP